jgi:hypothetical protein
LLLFSWALRAAGFEDILRNFLVSGHFQNPSLMTKCDGSGRSGKEIL